MTQATIFVAHAKADADEFVAASVARFKNRFPNTDCTFILGRDDWQISFRKSGSWEAWQKNVVYGVRYGTDKRKFDCIFLLDLIVGKATAKIVEHALEAGTRTVVQVRMDSSGPDADGNIHMLEQYAFKRVTGIQTVSDDWKNGWRVSY